MKALTLKERPKNLSAYVGVPNSIDDGPPMMQWIRHMMNQGGHNMHISECFLQTIAAVEAELAAQHYKILILPIEGKTASAEFFLERTPE